MVTNGGNQLGPLGGRIVAERWGCGRVRELVRGPSATYRTKGSVIAERAVTRTEGVSSLMW